MREEVAPVGKRACRACFARASFAEVLQRQAYGCKLRPGGRWQVANMHKQEQLKHKARTSRSMRQYCRIDCVAHAAPNGLKQTDASEALAGEPSAAAKGAAGFSCNVLQSVRRLR